jgi:hypothetical protein
MEIRDLKYLIASRLDVEEFLDILGWTLYDLVEELEDSVFEAKFEELVEACG